MAVVGVAQFDQRALAMSEWECERLEAEVRRLTEELRTSAQGADQVIAEQAQTIAQLRAREAELHKQIESLGAGLDAAMDKVRQRL